RLGLAGRRFVLLEPGRVGGLIKTQRKEGFLLEQGPNVFLDKRGFSVFLDKIGIGPDERIYPRVRRYGQYLWFEGRAAALPKSLGAFFRTPLFSLADKLKLAALPLRLWQRNWLAGAGGDESIADFLGRLLGPRVVKNVIDPALKGIYGGNADELSARSVFPLLWGTLKSGGSLMDYARARSKLRSGFKSRCEARSGTIFTLRDGGESLVQRLAEGVRESELLRTAAVRVAFKGGAGFEVETAEEGAISCRQVYVTTAGPASAVYLSEFGDEFCGALAKLRYTSLVVVHCAVEREAPIRREGYGVLFPAQPSRLLGVMYNSELFPHVAPVNRHLLTVMLGGSGASEICERGEVELIEVVKRELHEKLGIKPVQILGLQRWPRAIPQYAVGHFELVARMRSLERKFPGLRFAGADVGGVAVPDRVSCALGIDIDAERGVG
ncbi:MAG: protoporphyrinogen oxidase, partial [Deltaproteobacteria bacterium]|nr:protoporphyrinogen oxidase [Deltaproteobacteria bacterium]